MTIYNPPTGIANPNQVMPGLAPPAPGGISPEIMQQIQERQQQGAMVGQQLEGPAPGQSLTDYVMTLMHGPESGRGFAQDLVQAGGLDQNDINRRIQEGSDRFASERRGFFRTLPDMFTNNPLLMAVTGLAAVGGIAGAGAAGSGGGAAAGLSEITPAMLQSMVPSAYSGSLATLAGTAAGAGAGAGVGAGASSLMPAGSGVLAPTAGGVIPGVQTTGMFNGMLPGVAGGSGGAALAPGAGVLANTAQQGASGMGFFDNLFGADTSLLDRIGMGYGALDSMTGFSTRDAEGAIKSAQLTPASVVGPGGGRSDYDASTNTQTNTLGALDPLQQQLITQAQGQGVNPEIMAGLNAAATQGIGANTQAMQDQYLQLLRQQAQPYEQEAQAGLNQNLFSRGRLGMDDSVTGNAYREFAKGLGLADLSRQETALNFGAQETDRSFNRGIQAAGAGDALRTSDMQRVLQSTGGAGDLYRLGFLPGELGLQIGAGRANAQMGIGSNLTALAGQRTSPLDLFGAFSAGRSA